MLEIMVKLEEEGAEATPIARVNSVASTESLETPSREVVTLYGTPTAESLALAVAASLEAQKVQRRPDALRDLTISSDAGAVGDAAWRDASTGEMIRADLAIPLTVLKETAAELLMEGGQAIRRALAGLLQVEWPEGTRRALRFQLPMARPGRDSDALRAMREADGADYEE
jgi:hypothetical protein